MSVYHFTDSGRLPWLLASGAIEPTLSKIGGFPKDFVWASTNANGDKTASSYAPYRSGIVDLVRLTLRSEDFTPWTGAVLPPEWTSEHRELLERAARMDGTSPSTWLIRQDALPLDRVVNIHVKSWSSRWVELPTDSQAIVEGDVAYISIGEVIWASRIASGPQGSRAYMPAKFHAREAA